MANKEVIELEGTVEKPNDELENFYKKENINGLMVFPKTDLISKNHGSCRWQDAKTLHSPRARGQRYRRIDALRSYEGSDNVPQIITIKQCVIAH